MPTDTDNSCMGQFDNPIGVYLAAQGEIEVSKESGLEPVVPKVAGEVSDLDRALSKSKPVDSEIEDYIVSLLEEGRKNAAIKLYGRQTGVGLEEAKDTVEALAIKYDISPKAMGCAGAVVLMITVSLVIGIGARFMSL